MEMIICKMGTAFGESPNIGEYALASVVNELAAEGGRTFRLNARIFLPPDSRNAHMYEIEKKIKDVCSRQGIVLDGIRRTLGAPVSQCMVSVSGISVKESIREEGRRFMLPGQEIVLVNPVGSEGTLRLLEEREELKERFAPAFLLEIQEWRPSLWAPETIEAGWDAGASVIRQIGEGGIFAALWRLSEEAGTGLETDMKKILIRQETIEICEYLGLNPYQLASAGSLLMVAAAGEELAQRLQEKGIKAAVAGKFRGDNGKMIRKGEDVRYIDRPAADEIHRRNTVDCKLANH